MWALIVISIGLIIVEESIDPPADTGLVQALHGADRVILGIFVVELALRVLTYRPPLLTLLRRPPLGVARTHVFARLTFLMKPAQLIDLITILALHPALRGLRALRLLRLLRTVRVFHYGNPFAGIVASFEADRLLFVFAFGVFWIETVLGGVSLYLVERTAPGHQLLTLGDGIWWALVTLTTVGYGDYTPVTDLGRVIGGFLMVGGMVTLALFAGIVGHSLLNAVLSIREETFRMSSYINHIIVCGHEPGGEFLFDALKSEIDLDETRVVLFANAERSPDVPPDFLWVRGEPTKESELGKVRITHAKSVIVVGSRSVSPQHADATTILTVFTIRSYLEKQPATKARRTPVHVVAEILDTENVLHARAAGADEVIESQRLGYSMLAHTVRYPGVGDLTSEVVASGAASFYVSARPSAIDGDLSFGALCAQVRHSTAAIVIGFRDPKTGEQNINPKDDTDVPIDAEVVYLAQGPLLDPQRDT